VSVKKYLVPTFAVSLAVICMATGGHVFMSREPEPSRQPRNILETKGVGELSSFPKLQPHEVTPGPGGWAVSWNGRNGVITVESDRDLRITKWVRYHALDLK